MGLVMEYVEGPSLEQRLAARGPLPLDETLDIGAKIASALSAVHRAGLIHRDVKPANIIAGEGITKLIDFGIATARPDDKSNARSGSRRISLSDLPAEVLGTNLSLLGSTITITSSESQPELASGTVGYIDPVCIAEGLPASPSSDIYALGATLFESITGKLPSVLAKGSAGGMKGEVLDGRAPAPRIASLAPDVPQPLAMLIDAMLAPERDRRPPSAEQIAVELEGIRRARRGRARRVLDEDRGPFRVEPFTERDRDVFFGRSAEAASAIDMLRSQGLVAIAGAMGSGKTSLLRAAIVPTIADDGIGDAIEGWDVCVVELDGGDDKAPRAAVARALAKILPGASALTPEAIVLALAARAGASRRGTLVVIDRLEALAHAASSDAVWLAELLARIAEPPSPGLRAVVAVERSAIDPLLSLGALGRVLPRSLMLLADMSAAAWRDAVREAAAVYGYAFEDDALAVEFAEALAERRTRPAAQRALAALWNKRDTGQKRLCREGVELRFEAISPPGFGPSAPLPAFGPPPGFSARAVEAMAPEAASGSVSESVSEPARQSASESALGAAPGAVAVSGALPATARVSAAVQARRRSPLAALFAIVALVGVLLFWLVGSRSSTESAALHPDDATIAPGVSGTATVPLEGGEKSGGVAAPLTSPTLPTPSAESVALTTASASPPRPTIGNRDGQALPDAALEREKERLRAQLAEMEQMLGRASSTAELEVLKRQMRATGGSSDAAMLERIVKFVSDAELDRLQLFCVKIPDKPCVERVTIEKLRRRDKQTSQVPAQARKAPAIVDAVQ